MTESASTQRFLPILSVLQGLAGAKDYPFYAPGHKRGRGVIPELLQAWGADVFRYDLPELPEFDNLFCPSGAIAEAQALAAQVWGADQTWFLVNGSTVGLQAAILAVCGEGDKLLLPRNSHSSALAGVVLAGAEPIFLAPEVDAQWDLAGSFTPATLAAALEAHPDAKAVLALSPTYQGIGGDLKKIAELTHAQGLPLLVDGAHGAHLGFHLDFPPGALQQGADVVVQSAHKTLGALSQAALLHLQGFRVSPQRLSQALQLLQSTSPNALLLTSLDGARGQLQRDGAALMAQTLSLANAARRELNAIPGLKCLQIPEPRPGFHSLDPSRLTVDVSAWGLTGFEIDDLLRQKFQVTAELPTLRQLTFILSLGNCEADIAALTQAFKSLAPSPKTAPLILPNLTLPLTEFALTPRQALWAPREQVARAQAPGRINTRLLCPYPPGIPILVPGEIITPEAIEYLETILSAGGVINGLDSQGLDTWAVVA
ncbi:MAG: aminotransferase class I/II-fold pyridoxal phosphate-dependent enzyme [Cyanobacteriota bacterium]|jgi:arginine decarboxylase